MKDDIIRYGGRLSELEKKLGNAYREAVSCGAFGYFRKLLSAFAQTTEEAWDDDALFRNEGDEEEEGEFVMYADLPHQSFPMLILITGATSLSRSARISSGSRSSVSPTSSDCPVLPYPNACSRAKARDSKRAHQCTYFHASWP